MLAVALALRCWWFGNPVLHVDEQFYLLVGDRMLHGAVPFVDIWDRKPVGLFLIYAAIRLLGGGGIVQYQLVAAACAAAQALLVTRIARLHAEAGPARAAGVALLVWLIVFNGAGGQAPILYGPLMAGAALATFGAVLAAPEPPPRLWWRGALAMALVGVAIQIKYTAMFEGIGLGCLLLWAAASSRVPLVRGGVMAAAWIALALAPTLLALAWYAAHGHLTEFVFANFRSIGERAGHPARLLAGRLLMILGGSAPLVVAAVVACRRDACGPVAARARRAIQFWLVASLIGFAAIGTFYDHYFLPVLLPLVALAAPAFALAEDRQRIDWRATIALLTIGGLLAVGTSRYRLRQVGDGREVAALTAIIRPRLSSCLYVFSGEPILYYLTRSCLPTRFAFPLHLSDRTEAGAIGTDPAREVTRILATRPNMIVAADRPGKNANRATWRIMTRALARDYRPIAAVPIGDRLRVVYQRTD